MDAPGHFDAAAVYQAFLQCAPINMYLRARGRPWLAALKRRVADIEIALQAMDARKQQSYRRQVASALLHGAKRISSIYYDDFINVVDDCCNDRCTCFIAIYEDMI